MLKRKAFNKVIGFAGICAMIFVFYNCGHRIVKATVPGIEGSDYIGNNSCVDCHEDKCKKLSAEFTASIHGRLADFEAKGKKKGCEGCHGPGSVHAESMDTSKIIRFDDESISFAEKSEICLQCHTKAHWRSSEHVFNEVACTDCHKIHDSKENALLSEAEPKLCYKCHSEIRAKSLYPSHHPMWEQERTGRARMTCSDCHDAHGSPVRSLKTEESVNAICLKCHTRYQGPFVYEHAPVVEDCTICHDAHGSVANNLLKQNEPFLCIQCHEIHFHTGKNSLAGDMPDQYADILEQNTGGEVLHGPFPANGMKKAFATKCTQCHSQVHGSDLPSQTVPGRGGGLTR